MSKPTGKQKIVARCLFEGMSNVEAYRTAGYAIPRTENALRVRAHAVATCSNVLVMLQELEEKAIADSVATRLECEQTLTEIIRGRVTNYLEGNRINATLNDLNSAAIQEVNTAEVQVGKGEEALAVEVTKLKLHDPVKAIDALAKLKKWNTEPKAGDTNIGQLNISNTENKVMMVSFDPEVVAKAIMEAERLGISPELLGQFSED